jgi:hypothetical protein
MANVGNDNRRRFAGRHRLVWIVSILAAAQVQPAGAASSFDDHLRPVKEIADGQSPEAAYERLWRRKLLPTPGEIARSVHLPGNVGVETAISVYRKVLAKRVEYWVTATQSSLSLWGCVAPDAPKPVNLESIEVARVDARLPTRTALLVRKAWLASLRQTRQRPPSEEIMLDSSTEIFSAVGPDGKLLTGQFEGLGQGNTAALSALANSLLQYCDSPESERADIARKIDKAAADLLGRVASASENKEPDAESALSSRIVFPPKGERKVEDSKRGQGHARLIKFTPVKILGKKGVIVTQAFLRTSGLSAEGFWKPKRSQLKEIERALPIFLRKEKESRPSLAELSQVVALAPKYRRQYVGMILNGRKVIWINCIPRKPDDGVDPFEKWNSELVDVSDGGPNFWGVVYDTERHSFDKLIVNGSG